LACDHEVTSESEVGLILAYQNLGVCLLRENTKFSPESPSKSQKEALHLLRHASVISSRAGFLVTTAFSLSLIHNLICALLVNGERKIASNLFCHCSMKAQTFLRGKGEKSSFLAELIEYRETRSYDLGEWYTSLGLDLVWNSLIADTGLAIVLNGEAEEGEEERLIEDSAVIYLHNLEAYLGALAFSRHPNIMRETIGLAKCLTKLGKHECALKILSTIIGCKGGLMVDSTEEINFSLAIWYTSLWSLRKNEAGAGGGEERGKEGEGYALLVKALSLSQTAHENLKCLNREIRARGTPLGVCTRFYANEETIENLQALIARDNRLIRSLMSQTDC